jgi:hypothetical protein
MIRKSSNSIPTEIPILCGYTQTVQVTDHRITKIMLDSSIAVG